MRLLLLLSICFASVVWADETVPPLTDDEKRVIQERIKALHDNADAMRQEAEATFLAETKACWQKFLVTSCQDEAKRVKVEKLDTARRLTVESRQLDLSLRRRNHADHEAQMKETGPQRDADAAAQAEKNRVAQEELLAKIERKRQESAEAQAKADKNHRAQEDATARVERKRQEAEQRNATSAK